jgi:hypothetical protein
VPAELHVNRMQWLIRLCVMRGYVSVVWRLGMRGYVSVTWRPGIHRSVWLRCHV